MTKQYVTAQDLEIINKILNDGNDCRIQLTKEGYRIVSDAVKVVKKGVGPKTA